MDIQKYLTRFWEACGTIGTPGSIRLRRQTRRHAAFTFAAQGISAWLAVERLEQRQLLTAEISIANAAPVVEGQTASFTVTLDAVSSETVSVVYSTANGEGPTAATNGVDFVAINSQTLTFSPGQIQKTVTVSTTNDSIPEPTETFFVQLISSTGGTITTPRATGTILDNDAALPTLSIANAAAVVEGSSASFSVTLSAASATAVSVRYRATDGDGPTGAISGTDFPEVTDQLLTFSPGQTERTITIPTINDSSVEETETFEVILSSPDQATLAVSRAFGTILDNDTALPVLSISDAPQITEGGNAVFQVTLSAAASGPVTLLYDTVQEDEPTAATSGSDYVARSGQTLTFSAGQTQRTISIATIDDTTAESRETFNVRIRNATGAVIAVDRATGTILDNETAQLTLSITDAAPVDEGQSATFRVLLSQAHTSPVTVQYATATGTGPSTAVNGVDIVTQTAQTLTFAPGETEKLVTVVTVDDTDEESEETFRVILSNATGATITRSQGVGTITASDILSDEPTVQSPLGSISEPRPEFRWAAVAGAVSYDMELVQVGGSNNPVMQTTVTQTSVTATTNLAIGRYRTWVRANLSGGGRTAWVSEPFQINTTTSIHELPLHGTDRTPTIVWDAVTGATGYRVFINNTTTGQRGMIDQTVTATSFTPATDLSMGRYLIWVRPIGAGGYEAAWSVSEDYIVGPQPVAPTGSVSPLRPQFSWTSVPGAASYQLYVAGPSGVLINESGITGTSFTPTTDLPVGDFRWWIRPSTASGQTGSWSAESEFSNGGRTKVTTPRGETSNSVPEFSWPAVPGAQSYEVYLSRAGTPGAVFRQAGLTGTTLASPALRSGDYKVWIRTTLLSGSVWGRSIDFTVAEAASSLQTTGTAPLAPGFDNRPQFTWQATGGAATYDLALHNGTQRILQTGLTGTSWRPTAALAAADWNWSIRPVNSLGNSGEWSPPLQFSTSGRTSLVTPAATTTDRTPLFSWLPVTGAIRYLLQVDNLTTGASQVIREDQLTQTSFTPATALTPGNYRVWVRAVSSSAVGPWSVQRDFTVS